MIHLDTSFLIRALRPESPEGHKLRRWIHERRPLAMSSVAWAEFLCGPLTRSDLEAATRVIGRCREFGADDAATAADLFNQSGRRRGSLTDCMIAAAALSDGAAVATANTEHFLRFQNSGLTIV